MSPLTDAEKKDLIRRVTAGESLTETWRKRLFPDSGRAEPVGKEYRLVYEGKLKREEVLAQTPAAPWQLVREFCTDRPHADDPSTGSGQGWRNLLVWGDNLLALRGLLADQQGPDRFGTRGKIKLISEFRAQTLATDPEDFQNFETFSMAMVDPDYNGEVFRLGQVFWGEDLINAAGGLEKAARLELRVAEQEFTGERMMVILCDRYHFYFLSPEDYTEFFGQIRDKNYGWRSGLMQTLQA